MKKFLLGMMAMSMTASIAGAAGISPQWESLGNSQFRSITIPQGTVVNSATQSAPTRAGESREIEYTVADSPYSALGLNNMKKGSQVKLGMHLTPEMTTDFAGCEIKSINFYTGVNQSNRNAILKYTVFVQEAMDSEPIYTKECTVSADPFKQYKVDLDETFTLEEGKDLYVGCYFSLSSANDYYIVVDGISTTDTTSSYVWSRMKETDSWAWLEGFPVEAYGSICLGVTLEGDKYPLDKAGMVGIDLPRYTAPNAPFELTAYVKSLCANEINDIELECKVGNANPVSLKAEMQGMSLNKTAALTIDGLVCSEIAKEVPVEVKVVKVNGVDNDAPVIASQGTVACFEPDRGFKAHGLIEEGTGTWCGWCPRGIVMMETAREEYAEIYNCIALHSNDRMANASTSEVIAAYFEGFPSAMVNRWEVIDPQVAALDYYYERVLKNPTWAGIESIEVTNVSDQEATIVSKAKFTFDEENADRYRVAYYLTEDGIGPYPQTNSYAGGRNGEMGGWESKAATVMTVYNDVARLLLGGLDGFSNSYPEKIVAGQEYSHTISAPLTAITGESYFVTAFIIDTVTGEVVNSQLVKADKVSGVEAVTENGTAVVRGGAGCVTVSGEFAQASVYTLAGQKVGELNGEGSVAAAAGIYVVNVDGAARKVVVK
jgi:hypothetical protein